MPGCTAKWNNGELELKNGRSTRVLRAVKGAMRTVSFRRDEFEWVNPKVRDLKVEGPIPTFSAEKASWSSVGDAGLRVTADFGNIKNSWLLLPSIAGIIEERTSQVSPASLDPKLFVGDRNFGVTRMRKGRVLSEGADPICHAPYHVRVTEFALFDQTDYTNELISEREWLLMMRELPVMISSNVLTMEDPTTGEGLAFVRLAPLDGRRPVNLPDFVICGSQYGAFGHSCVTPVANGWPVAEFAYSGGKKGRVAAFQAFQRALRQYRPERDGILLSNTWGGGNSDSRIQEDFLNREIDAGAKLGVDVIQIDDGWQKGRSMNSSDAAKRSPSTWGNFRHVDPDFWKPCPIRIPHGLEPLVRKAKDYGMRFGLWYGPDSSDNAKYWSEDADCLLDFHKRLGIDYFKIDSLNTKSAEAFVNERKFFDRMLAESNGQMCFDLDVTAGIRPGYFGLPHIGPLFVENRYTNHAGYFPFQTLRSIWSLAHIVDPVRMRIEFLDPKKYLDRYDPADPQRPELFRADALFAIAMVASPLAWLELSELDAESMAQLQPLVKRWKAERRALHGGTTWPIAARPDGIAWTGFATAATTGGGYLLLFRELNESDSFEFDIGEYLGPVSSVEVIGGRGEARLTGSKVAVSKVAQRDFIWLKFKS